MRFVLQKEQEFPEFSVQYYFKKWVDINHFHANVPFQYPLKPKVFWRFQGYRNGTLAWKGLIHFRPKKKNIDLKCDKEIRVVLFEKNQDQKVLKNCLFLCRNSMLPYFGSKIYQKGIKILSTSLFNETIRTVIITEE